MSIRDYISPPSILGSEQLGYLLFERGTRARSEHHSQSNSTSNSTALASKTVISSNKQFGYAIVMANTVDLLPANLQSTLHQIVDRVNASNGGIRVILLSTAEGVPLGRVYADRNMPLNEDILSSIESTWAPASKQFPLLNMGKEARIVTAIYDHGEIVEKFPVQLSIIIFL